jgi:sensor histidine kinase regulating citrate/malate metabolism
MSLARQLLLLQLAVVAVAVVVVGAVAVKTAADRAADEQRERVLSLGEALARFTRRSARRTRRTSSSRWPSACGARPTSTSSCS